MPKDRLISEADFEKDSLRFYCRIITNIKIYRRSLIIMGFTGSKQNIEGSYL